MSSRSIQELLDAEKTVRAKTVLDPQMQDLLQHLREQGLQTVWDVQAAYDSDFLGLKDRCGFGTRGLCCRNCAMGPCRLASEDMPRHLKAVSPTLNRSTCGKTADSMVASMQLSTTLRGASSHLAHALDVVETFHKVAFGESNGNYRLTDTAKLTALAARLGVPTAGLDPETVARAVAQIAWDDLAGTLGDSSPMRFFDALAPKNVAHLEKTGLIPRRGAALEVMKLEHSTSQGMNSNTIELLRACLLLGVYDVVGLFMATELQDVLLGTPVPRATRMGMDNLARDKVNVVVHGHNPLFSDRLVDAAEAMEAEARAAGAQGVNLVAICCTGNELAQRRGIPMLGNNLHQELAVATGLVDAFVVDYQCIYPTLSSLVGSYHTRLVTTQPAARMEAEVHIPFRTEHAAEDARKVIEVAIDGFKARKAERVHLPARGGFDMLLGFSAEACVSVLDKLSPGDPLKPLVDLIKSGDVRGVVAIVGCTSPKLQSGTTHVTIARELLSRDVLVVATGCAAGALARGGMLTSAATEQWAGPRLRGVLGVLGKTAGLGGPLPPVWHMGSCVDNSRIFTVVSALADYLGVSVDALPVAASAPEHVAEKADAIGLGALGLGIATHLGVSPRIGGSPFVLKVLTQEMRALTGSHMIVEPEPVAAAGLLFEHIQQKRTALGLD